MDDTVDFVLDRAYTGSGSQLTSNIVLIVVLFLRACYKGCYCENRKERILVECSSLVRVLPPPFIVQGATLYKVSGV